MDLPQACLFDLDGVLLNTEPLHGQAWKETAEVFGKTLTTKQLNLLKGRQRKDCAKKIIEWLNEAINEKDVLAVHQPLAKKHLSGAKAIPGAEDLVRWCATNNLPIALVTSSTSESVKFKTKTHKWIDLFSIRVQGDDPYLKQGKPAPDPFLLAALKLNVNPQRCWAIEDSLSGVQSAIAAGCQVWLLETTRGNQKKLKSNLQGSNPLRISRLSEILDQLKNM